MSKKDHAITSHYTEDIATALKCTASDDGKPASTWVHDLVVAELVRRGLQATNTLKAVGQSRELMELIERGE